MKIEINDKLDPLKDGISKVEYLDHMGTDLTVVNAARVSMNKESEFDVEYESKDNGYEEMTFKLKKSDQKLIKYLADHGHWTPFSQPQIQLRIKMPIFIARQWFKHTVGFTRNEVSRRYVSSTPEIYVPTEWRKAAENVKQGSSTDVYTGNLTMPTGHSTPFTTMSEAVRHYNYMIECGICSEQARMVLPQSMYTEFVETGSLAAYARLCNLRLDDHAQKEVQWYAEAVAVIVKDLYPESYNALVTGE